MSAVQGMGRKHEAAFLLLMTALVAAPRLAAEEELVTPPTCSHFVSESRARALGSILRSQDLLTPTFPSDSALRCGQSVDVGARMKTLDQEVKASGFSAKTDGQMRHVYVDLEGGIRQWRYGVQIENRGSEFTTTQNLVGVSGARSETKRGEDGSVIRADASGVFGSFGAGIGLQFVSAKQTFTQPIAGQSVTTKSPQLNVVLPVLSVDWRHDNGILTLARQQAAEVSKEGGSLREPWRTNLRYLRLLDGEQGVRFQFERLGARSDDTKPFHQAQLAYFLAVDEVTVDVAWAKRFASYKIAADASPDDVAAFEFSVAAAWEVSPQVSVYGALNSLSGNEELGGSERRSAQILATGGSAGVRITY